MIRIPNFRENLGDRKFTVAPHRVQLQSWFNESTSFENVVYADCVHVSCMMSVKVLGNFFLYDLGFEHFLKGFVLIWLMVFNEILLLINRA